MVGGDPFYLKFWVKVGAKSPIFDLLITNRKSITFVAPQPYDLAKKVQLTLIGIPLHAFQ